MGHSRLSGRPCDPGHGADHPGGYRDRGHRARARRPAGSAGHPGCMATAAPQSVSVGRTMARCPDDRRASRVGEHLSCHPGRCRGWGRVCPGVAPGRGRCRRHAPTRCSPLMAGAGRACHDGPAPLFSQRSTAGIPSRRAPCVRTMVSAATAWNAGPASPATARSPHSVARGPRGADAGTGSRGGGRPSWGVWRRTRHRHTLGRTPHARDHHDPRGRTSASGASPTPSSTDAPDHCVQPRAPMVGKTAVVVAGVHACGCAP